MNRTTRISLCIISVVLVSALASAQGMAAAKTTTAEKSTGFRAEALKEIDDVGGKTVALAEAIPQEKYSWRPGEGVRSVGEVFVHITGGNFLYMRMLGGKTPADIDMKALQAATNDKAKVVEALKRSFDFVRQTVNSLPDADLEKAVKMFGTDTTERHALFAAVVHQSEHLGQSIAYARSVGVVPPWTAKAEEDRKAAAAAKAAEKPKQ